MARVPSPRAHPTDDSWELLAATGVHDLHVFPLRRVASIGSWALLAGAAGYFAYHFVLVGDQYFRVALTF